MKKNIYSAILESEKILETVANTRKIPETVVLQRFRVWSRVRESNPI